MSLRSFVWVPAALLAIAVSAAVAWAASQLAGQRIGLTSEPLSVASRLAPPAQTSSPAKAAPKSHPRRAKVSRPRPVAPARTTSSVTAPPPPVTVTRTVAPAPSRQRSRPDGGSSSRDDSHTGRDD